MSIKLNKLFIAGNLTKKPEMRTTPGGNCVCNVVVAVNQGTRDKPETIFVEVTIWNKSAEFVSQYLDKGSLVLIEGELKQEAWEDKDTGKKRTKLCVTARNVHSLGRTSSQTPEASTAPAMPVPDIAGHRYAESDIPGRNDIPDMPPDDDIPF